jgi:CHAT domain-containing protein/Flp pilus assembly protein TadD
MRYSAKLLGLFVAGVIVPCIQRPGFSQEIGFFTPMQAQLLLAQSSNTADRKAEADRLFQQGIEQYRISQFREALQSWEQALDIYREIGDRAGEGRALGNLGNAYLSLGDYQQAIDLYEQHLAIAREIGDRAGEGRALNNLGIAYRSLGDYQQAIDLYEQVLAIFREIGDRAGEGSALGNLGNAYHNLGDYQQAIDLYEQVLAIFREIGDRAGEGRALGNLGSAYLSLGDYQQAIDLHEQSLAIAREIGDRAGEGAALGNLGGAYYSLGDYQQAIDLYEQRLAIAREIGDRAGEGNALGNLGNAYRNLGDYQQAIDLYEQQLVITREIGDRAGEGRALGGLGGVYANLGDYQQAIDLYEQQLVITREIGDRAGEGRALNNLGEAYRNLGDYQQAIDLYEQGLIIFREIGRRAEEGAILGNLGIAYNDLGNYQQAIDLYEQHLAIAREIRDRAGEGRALGNLGVAYDNLGDYQQAIDFYQQALTLSQSIGGRAETGILLNNLGRAFAQLDQPELAIVFLKSSVDVREAIRGDITGLDAGLQQSFTDTVADSYRFLADLLLQEDRIIEAQRILDLLKVQELEEYRRGVQRTADSERGVDFLRPEEAILASLGELQQSAIDVGQELAELQKVDAEQLTADQKARIDELDALLTQINADFREFSRQPEIRALIADLSFEAREASVNLGDLDSLRDELRQLNAVIFYPLILEDRLELVITTPDSPPLRRTVQVSRAELNQAILAFRDHLTTADPAITTSAQQIYDWLMAPLEEDLAKAGVDTIIYAPDGQLRYIPLAALHNGENWLAEDFKVHNIIARSLADITETDGETPRIMAAAFADPTLVYAPEVNGRTYDPLAGLPGAGAEVQALPAAARFIDEDFSLAAVKPEFYQYNILHFATHAAFVPGVPEDSFILFGNGDTPTLRDVESWSLNHVDLVVLSACETGVGGLGNGEEILGLGYQFQLSGAKSVMASLWQVSDEGTKS